MKQKHTSIDLVAILNLAILSIRPNYDFSSQISKTYNIRGERILAQCFPEDGDPLATCLNGLAGLCMQPHALTELFSNRLSTIDLPTEEDNRTVQYMFMIVPPKRKPNPPFTFSILADMDLIQVLIPARCIASEKALSRFLAFALQGDVNPYVIRPSDAATRCKQAATTDCGTQLNQGNSHSTNSNASMTGVNYIGDLKKIGMPGKPGISEHTRHVKSVLTMNDVILDLIPNADLSTQTSGVYNFYGADILIYSLAEHKDPLETFIQGLAALSENRGDLESLITTNGAIIPLKDADGSRVDKYIFRLLESTRPEKYILAVLYSGFILVEFPARHLWDEPDCLCPLAAFIGSETNPNEIKPWDGSAGK